jgi:rhodanese-related sulfurtransferase
MITGRIRLAVAAAGALLAVAACAGDAKGQPFTLVSVDEVERMVGKPDVLVVDANPEDVFLKAHVPGAQWWRSKPLAQLLPPDKDRRLVFYCASPH